MFKETRAALAKVAQHQWFRLRKATEATTTRADLALARTLRGSRGGCDRFGHSFGWARFGRKREAETVRTGETLWLRCQWCRDAWTHDPGEDPVKSVSCPQCSAGLPATFGGCPRCGANLAKLAPEEIWFTPGKKTRP